MDYCVGLCIVYMVLIGLIDAVRGENVVKDIELSSLTAASGIALSGTSHNARTGWSVSGAGDLNGDGIGDILVSSPLQDNNDGNTRVVFGKKAFSNIDLSTEPTSKTTGFTIRGAAFTKNGNSLSSVGDFNGDGLDDIVIGATGGPEGEACVIFGRNTSISANVVGNINLGSGLTRGFYMFGIDSGDGVGFSVSGAGDFNNDGLDDVLIAASTASPLSRSGAGVVYVIFGSRAVFSEVDLSSLTSGSTAGFQIFGAATNYRAGYSVSSAGDVNGDGISDIIIGSASDLLMSHVIFGRTASSVNDIDLVDFVSDRNKGFRILGITGRAVSSAGDVNGDGIGDLIVSSPFAGATYVIFGYNVTSDANAFTDINLDTFVTGPTNGFKILLPQAEYITLSYTIVEPGNHYISTAGDINNDGYADLLVGAPGYSPTTNRAYAGRVYVIFGRSSFIDVNLTTMVASLSTGFRIAGTTTQDQVGYAVNSLGDVNGDGIDDFIIGAPYAYNQADRRGGAYVIFGANFVDNPTSQPSRQPSSQPSRQPSAQPTSQPSRAPTSQPSRQPSEQPSNQPTGQPSLQPLAVPSSRPSSQPSSTPSGQPTVIPSSRPSVQPLGQPSWQPTNRPSTQPTVRPTCQPSSQPSVQPVVSPSSQPTSQPSVVPSTQLSTQPSSQPSRAPSAQPKSQPSSRPSTQPSSIPTSQPSSQPSIQPSAAPSDQPTCQPSRHPSSQPSKQPSSGPSTKPSVQPTSRPSRQPTSQPSRQPSRQPSGQPTRQPSRQPTAEPSILTVIGEWSAVVAAGAVDNSDVVSGNEALVGSEVWICGAQFSNNECVVFNAVSGNRVTQFALPWEVVSDVTSIGVTNRVMLRGQTTDSTGAVITSIASCDISVAELTCTAKVFANAMFMHTAYAAHLAQLIHVGKSTNYGTATVIDASLNKPARNYYYSGSGMRSIMLLRAASLSNFIGSFVAGTSVSTGYVNNIVAGWVHMDSGDLSAMSLLPTSSTSNILNSAELVNAMVLEPQGPDMFIGGALQLSSYNNGERTAYLIRANSMYLQVKYGVRYKFTGESGGQRRQLRGSSASYSSLQCITRVNNVLYAVINYAHAGKNDTRFSVLKISAANGAIAQQASIYVHNMSLACSDITSTGLALSLACSLSHNVTYTQSLLIAVDTDFTLSRLSTGLLRDKSTVFQAQSVSFTATRMPTVKNNLPITTTDESFVAKSDMEFPPTQRPSVAPTVSPSSQPSSAPSGQPSCSPSAAPSVSTQPTSQPSTGGPTNTYKPTVKPSFGPTLSPTINPTARPSTRPTFHPTSKPTARPTATPSTDPSLSPSVAPSLAPVPPVTSRPTRVPSYRPSALRPISKPPTEEPTSLELAAGGLGKAKSGKDDTRDQIIAVSVLGAAWVIGLCLYLYCTHRAADVKKETENTAPIPPVTLPETTTTSTDIAVSPPHIVPPVLDSDDDESSMELSSLHSSEISGNSYAFSGYDN